MAARRVALILAVIAATGALLIGGCQVDTPRPVFDSPLNGTAQAIALDAYATRSAAEVGAVEAQAQATAQAAIYAATLTALEAQADRERERATAQAAQVTAQAEGTRQAVALEMTCQAEAIRATQETRRREATWQASQATAQAEATAGAMALQATATRQAWSGRVTATAETYRATQVAYQATATRQAQQRDEVLAYGRDYGIPLALLAVAGGLGAMAIYGIRQHARRPIVYPRNFLGDAEPMAVPVKGGGYTFVDLDRQPGPAITVLPDGRVSAPQLREPGQEERTTARDQLLDLTARPKLGAGQKASGAPALPMAPPPTPPAPGLRSVRMFRRLDQAGRVGVVPPPLLASLEADWETEPGEGI